MTTREVLAVAVIVSLLLWASLVLATRYHACRADGFSVGLCLQDGGESQPLHLGPVDRAHP